MAHKIISKECFLELLDRKIPEGATIDINMDRDDISIYVKGMYSGSLETLIPRVWVKEIE